MNFNHRTKITGLSILATTIVVAVFFVAPVAQDISYHLFADQRTIIGIPNFWNVMTNAPFILVGLYGFVATRNKTATLRFANISTACNVFYLGLVLSGLASGFYHLSPDNDSLFWDRLPMTLSFMGFFAFVLTTHVNMAFGRKVLWPLVIVGLLSVIYWAYSESAGEGDLRFYAVVQFLPVVLVPLILLMFPVSTYRQDYLWMVVVSYILAKLLEYFDSGILQIAGISGHSLKHIVVALTGILFMRAVSSLKV